MIDLKQFTTPFSLPFTPTYGSPLVAAKDSLSMSMGTSRFAGGIPKASAPATSKIEAPKLSWNRELDFSGNTKIIPPEKKGGIANQKLWALQSSHLYCVVTSSTRRRHHTSHPKRVANQCCVTTTNSSGVNVPGTAAAAVVTPPPIMSAPSPTRSANLSEPPVDDWKENSKVKKENIIYLQRLFKEGLKKDEIAK